MDKFVRKQISKEKNERKLRNDRISKRCFMAAAFLSASAIIVILLFVGIKGIAPFLPGYANGQVNVVDFLLGTTWRQDQEIYGVGYIIINTLISFFWRIAAGISNFSADRFIYCQDCA